MKRSSAHGDICHVRARSSLRFFISTVLIGRLALHAGIKQHTPYFSLLLHLPHVFWSCFLLPQILPPTPLLQPRWSTAPLRFQMSTFCVDHPPKAVTHYTLFKRKRSNFSEMCVACRLPFIIISQNSLLYQLIFLGSLFFSFLFVSSPVPLLAADDRVLTERRHVGDRVFTPIVCLADRLRLNK